MTKDEKGITIVSLVITIIVMLIIFGVVMGSATVLLDHAKVTNIKTQLSMAKSRAETLIEQYSFENNLIYLSAYNSETGLKPCKMYCGNKNNYSSSIKDYLKIDSSTMKDSIFNSIGSDTKLNNFIENSVSKIVNTSGNPYYNWNAQYNYEKTENGITTTIPFPKLIAVKWDLDVAYYHRLYKSKNDSNAIIDNTNDFIVVIYNLENKVVEDTFYSKGYKGNISLDQMMKIDAEEAE